MLNIINNPNKNIKSILINQITCKIMNENSNNCATSYLSKLIRKLKKYISNNVKIDNFFRNFVNFC